MPSTKQVQVSSVSFYCRSPREGTCFAPAFQGGREGVSKHVSGVAEGGALLLWLRRAPGCSLNGPRPHLELAVGRGGGGGGMWMSFDSSLSSCF